MRNNLLLTTAVVFGLSAPAAFAQQQQPAPQQPAQGGQVTVDQAQPEVTVQQPQPEVTVQQPQPEVTVQQPQPEVTVQQPEPEVTVQQPEPEVTVEQAEPEVTVEQAEPQVNVEQAEPQVNVDQAEPQVETQQAEPQVETQPEGEQTGATTTLPTADDPAAETQPADDQAAAPATEPATGAAAPAAIAADDVIGRNIVGQDGETIGEVQDLVMDSQTGEIDRAIVQRGGFLGIGGRQIAIDWSRIQVNPETDELTTDMTEADLEVAPEYEASEADQTYTGTQQQ